MDEKDLIDRLRQGDEEALRALLRRHTPLLRYVLKPLLPDERDREECLADISMKLWQNTSFYDEKRGSFRTWLTVLARNSALNRLRAQHPEDVTLHEGLPHGDGSAEDALLRRERQQQLTAALSRLPSDERALFYRKYWYRQPTAQIAAELGLSPRAVEGRLYRIRQKLRQELGGDFCGE